MALLRAATAVHGWRGCGSRGGCGALLRRCGGGTERKDDKGRQQNEWGTHGKTPDEEGHGTETRMSSSPPYDAAAGAKADGRQDAAQIRSAWRPGVSKCEALERNAWRRTARQIRRVDRQPADDGLDELSTERGA
jgi:hypothetical protein